MPAHPQHPHLPEGREPGAQSRRRRGGLRIAAVLYPILGIGLLGGGVFLIVAGQAAVAAIPIAMGIAFLALGFFFGRNRAGRRAQHLEITVERPELRRGETVGVRLRITDTSVAREQLEIGLECKQWYDVMRGTGDNRRQETREETVVERFQRASPKEPIQSLSFDIPADAPFSYEGKLLSYAWRVTAREPASMRADKATDEPIWVHP